MEGLFFVVSPVWWVGSISTLFIVIAVFVGVLFGLFSYRKKQDSTHIPQKIVPPYRYIPITPSEPLYIEKTLQEIRKYCAYIYSPMHSWAHIPDDIKSYVSDKNIIRILELLEEYEYTGKMLDLTEKELINHELATLLQ